MAEQALDWWGWWNWKIAGGVGMEKCTPLPRGVPYTTVTSDSCTRASVNVETLQLCDNGGMKGALPGVQDRPFSDACCLLLWVSDSHTKTSMTSKKK
eukprot:511769-Pelagomonas_calceolata.AAC.1